MDTDTSEPSQNNASLSKQLRHRNWRAAGRRLGYELVVGLVTAVVLLLLWTVMFGPALFPSGRPETFTAVVIGTFAFAVAPVRLIYGGAAILRRLRGVAD